MASWLHGFMDGDPSYQIIPNHPTENKTFILEHVPIGKETRKEPVNLSTCSVLGLLHPFEDTKLSQVALFPSLPLVVAEFNLTLLNTLYTWTGTTGWEKEEESRNGSGNVPISSNPILHICRYEKYSSRSACC